MPETKKDIGNRRRLDRMSRLRTMVQDSGSTGLADAARELGVSSMTLRRDLEDRTYGFDLLDGEIFCRDFEVVHAAEDIDQAYSLERHQSMHYVAKIEAGRNAARLVEPGDAIFVDSGTTMVHLLAALPKRIEITVVCCGLNVAIAATRLTRAQVHMLGGVLEPSTQSFASDASLHALQQLRIDKAFISAGGIHETDGASCAIFRLVPIKRAAVALAKRAFLVADSSKLSMTKPARFAPLHAFERVVTERPDPALDAMARGVSARTN